MWTDPLVTTEPSLVMRTTPLVTSDRASRPSGILASTTLILAIGCMVVVLAGATAPWLWLGDLAVHWSGHAALGLLPALVVWRRRPRHVVPLALVLIAAFLPGMRSMMEPRSTVAADPTRPITVAFANVYDFNRDRSQALQAIDGIDAEVVGLTEVSVRDRVRITSKRWPFQHWEDRDGTLSVALLSTYPILSATLHDADGAGVLEATLDLGEERLLRVIVAHLFSPKSGASTHRRNEQVRLVTNIAVADSLPLLLLGDLNLSPASPHWRAFISDTGFKRALGTSPATWPAVFGPCGIAIDHLLVRNLGLNDLGSFSIPGSDHRGLRAIAWVGTNGGG